jgi:hypothetical protein
MGKISCPETSVHSKSNIVNNIAESTIKRYQNSPPPPRPRPAIFSQISVLYFILRCVLLLLLFTAIELSLSGSSPYTSTDETNKNKIA